MILSILPSSSLFLSSLLFIIVIGVLDIKISRSIRLNLTDIIMWYSTNQLVIFVWAYMFNFDDPKYICYPRYICRTYQQQFHDNCRYLCVGCPWWRHQMETFSASLALCAGNSTVNGEFPPQRPVTRGFDVLFDLRLNNRLSKQSWGWLFEMPSRPWWHHCTMTCRCRQSQQNVP